MNRKKVAFICVHNSCRSQMAEAFELPLVTVVIKKSLGYNINNKLTGGESL